MNDNRSPPAPRPIVGIVGGIGSGKSTVARWVAEHHPAAVIDADRIGHALLKDPRVQYELLTAFGPEIVDATGGVSRSALAARVFGTTPEQQAARAQLDGILHPAIRAEMLRQAAAVDPAKAQVILFDAAILLESGWRDVCRGVVFVDTPLARRQAWVAEHRGWTAEELSRREASQWPLDRKRAAADDVIANDSDVATAGTRLWAAISAALSL